MMHDIKQIRYQLAETNNPSDTKLDYMLKRLGLFMETCVWMTGKPERFRETAFFERATATSLVYAGLAGITPGSLIIATWGYLDCTYSYAIMEAPQRVFTRKDGASRWISLDELVKSANEAYQANPKLGKPEFFHIRFWELSARVNPHESQTATPYDEPSFLKF